jgi:hypothetical protein
MRSSYTFLCAHDLRRHRCLSYFEQDQFFSWCVHCSCFPSRPAHCDFQFPVWAKHWHRLVPVAAHSKPSAMFPLHNATSENTTAFTMHFKCLPSRRGFNSTSPRVTCLCVNLWIVCPKGRCPAETGCLKIILLYSIAGCLGFAYRRIFRNRTQDFRSWICSRLQVRGISLVHWTNGAYSE